jgi:hypothetical protein
MGNLLHNAIWNYLLQLFKIKCKNLKIVWPTPACSIYIIFNRATANGQ